MSKSKNSLHKDKKAAILKKNHTLIKPRTILLIALAGLVSASLAFYITGIGTQPSNTASVTKTASHQVTYPVNVFGDGKARHFDFKADGMTIRYFIIKSSDGIIRAAFDACDVCWPAGKGYYQEGDEMVCRNCGRRFASVLINEVKGGCNPAPLTRSVQGGQLILKVEDIRQGKSYFNFKKKA